MNIYILILLVPSVSLGRDSWCFLGQGVEFLWHGCDNAELLILSECVSNRPVCKGVESALQE
jgi:hypothetical protein